MAQAFDTVTRLNAAARAAGTAESILQFDNIATQAQYRLPYEITAAQVKAGDNVLDWGCGNGHFSLFLGSLGARVTGFSFEPPPVAMRGVASFSFVPGSPSDPCSLPFPDAAFDAVAGVGVLEHVWETGGDEAASLAELARVLKPGGVLLVFHLPSETGWIEGAVRVMRLKKHLHGRRYGAELIRGLWSSAGFTIIDMGRYNTLPRAELALLPGALKHSVAFATIYDFVDGLVARVAPRVCTNYFVVARNRR